MLGSGRFLSKRIDSLPKVFNAWPSLRQCIRSTHSAGKIVIPKRIERGPTDILEALSSTVNVDPTAYHYKFCDDPYLYPFSVGDKKAYALAKESGKKSAEWIIKENTKFFMDDLAEPPIKAFKALTVSIKEEELSEQGLLNAIEERNVLSAIEMYNNLKSKQIDVEKSTKQSLLELVCFYNSEEKPNLDFEEKWLEEFLGKAGANIQTEKKWNPEFAESLFAEMDTGCPLALSAIIQGMLKYKEFNAMELFEEAVAKKMTLPVNVYNAVLEHGVNIKKSETSAFIKKLLEEMRNQNVIPNLGTLNGALRGLSRTYGVDFSLKLIKEFINLGIKPSLGSYGYLFRMIANLESSSMEHRSYKNLVLEIFEKLENEEHEILHPCDFSFFRNTAWAFSIVRGFEEGDLLLRLHNMYLKPGNRKFIVKGLDDHWFYKYLIPLLFKTQPIDMAMDFYRRHVFTLVSPQTEIGKEILYAIRENLAPEYLPEVWRDFQFLRCAESRPILTAIFEMVDDFTDESSTKVFHEAAINFLNTMRRSWKDGDVDTLPFILLVLLRNKDEKRLEETMSWIQSKGLLFKNMKESVIQSVFEFGMERKNSVILIGSLYLADEERMAALGEMSEKALPLLSGAEKAWASGLLATAKKREKKLEKPSDVTAEIPDVEV